MVSCNPRESDEARNTASHASKIVGVDLSFTQMNAEFETNGKMLLLYSHLVSMNTVHCA